MSFRAARFPDGLKKAFLLLMQEANKVGWMVWVPQEDEPIIDGFVCGNERFIKRVGISLARNEIDKPVDKPERTH